LEQKNPNYHHNLTQEKIGKNVQMLLVMSEIKVIVDLAGLMVQLRLSMTEFALKLKESSKPFYLPQIQLVAVE